MTDNEIIKALECCCVEHACSKCHYSEHKTAMCITEIMRDALDLINRQREEIERLKTAGEEAISCFNGMESLYNIKCVELKVARAEAVKEFAERLKEDCPAKLLVIHFDALDNLAKEMVGEQ